MGIKIEGKIEKVNGLELSYDDFVKRYMEKNQPVVLTGLTDQWRACTDWVTSNGKPNLQFFATHFPKSTVQVADCGTREFTDQKRVQMSVSKFVDQWVQGSVQEEGSNASTKDVRDKPLLYLKDWHLVKEYPEYTAYTTPLFFCDDWLNLYLDNYRMHKDSDVYSDSNEICCSDYRFVYMGEKGSWTPLHADVFRSYSWSANVCGKKRWLFLSPSQSHLVFDRNMKSSVYNIFDEVSETKFPGFKKAIWLECIQEPNEIIFVPSGWYHQVHNLEDTISINHNWFNGYNLCWVWDLLLKDYNEAKEYIEDIKDICDDFEGLCQRNLAANTGMNFYDFLIFLARVCFANLVQICHLRGDGERSVCNMSPVAQQLTSNLVSIQKIALKVNSLEGLTKTHKSHFNSTETLSNPEFIKLCMVLEKTYGVIYSQQTSDYHSKRSLVDDIRDLDIIKGHTFEVSTPEDLAKLIDHFIRIL
ncbi:arginine-specific demethylase JMJ20 isoform X1 [Cannabis sativa]|uniref:arginine-specific demethylase JMJ20 isoform X1 n=1 Tax=Cannabis sativa TaxID=3483 RepID=UPI0029C9FF79|nr:arginine-specific demethylase JMJ20 isoform X1 [Cannabis sativa]